MEEQEKEYNILCQRDGETRTATSIQELLQDLVQAEEDGGGENGNGNGNGEEVGNDNGDKHVKTTVIAEKVVVVCMRFWCIEKPYSPQESEKEINWK